MPQFKVARNGVTFSIRNCSHVLMQEGGVQRLLQGEEGSFLTHLSYDGRNLYGFRDDGFVVQWDPATGLSSKLETSVTQNHPLITKWRQSFRAGAHGPERFCQRLEAQDGFLVISYGLYHSCPIFEVRDLAKNTSQIFEDSDIKIPEKLLIQDKKLYMLQRDTILVWDLASSTKERLIPIDIDPSELLWDFAVSKERICAYTFGGKLYVMNRADGSQTSQFNMGGPFATGTIILDHLLIVCSLATITSTLTTITRVEQGISLFDLRTGNQLTHLSPIYDKNGYVLPTTLENLLLQCKKALSEENGLAILDPLKSFFQRLLS